MSALWDALVGFEERWRLRRANRRLRDVMERSIVELRRNLAPSSIWDAQMTMTRVISELERSLRDNA